MPAQYSFSFRLIYLISPLLSSAPIHIFLKDLNYLPIYISISISPYPPLPTHSLGPSPPLDLS